MPQPLSSLSKWGQTYLVVASVIGLTIAAYSLYNVVAAQVDLQWLILAALTLLTGSFTVRIPRINARLSVSDTFIFASVLLFGPSAGTLTVILDALVISLRFTHFKQPLRVLFNLSVAAISIWCAAQIFFSIAGIKPYSIEPTPLARIAFPLLLFTLTYFLVNTWMVAFALSLEQRKPAYPIWRYNFLWLSVNYFGGASVAGLLVTYTRTIEPTTLGIIIPLLLISYLTFKTSMGRIDDANRHLTEVNKLYLSTIETLAMAIDAKDQITHGHIRRVQRLAVGLAKTVGVTDELQIRAIEAAALLHDMGKLAIPEFILNKPGRLTPNEFDVMKQHANIGADILGSIQFPYPVVPIVRHHHESWDGSGYPDGLKGVAIPLGARVLSVVDCFDALTSDRPYRPRLSTDDAITVLLQRRGTMYDPLIVDKFIEAQRELSRIAEMTESPEGMETIATKLRLTPEPKPEPVVNHDDRLPIKALTLLRSIRPSPAGIAIDDVGLLISKHLAKLTEFSGVAIYIGTDNQRAIKCRYADGPLTSLVEGPEIQLGEQLSGWVAAHRTPIWNSDATLDLPPDVARAAGVALGSSVPLIDEDVLIGAITVYSRAGKEIGLEQRMLIQALAPSLAKTLAASVAHDEIAAIDSTNQSEREALYAVLDSLLSGRAQGHDRTHPERLTIVRVRWNVDANVNDKTESLRATLDRAVAMATTGTGHAIRLGPRELLVVAAFGHLLSAGLEPHSQHRTPRGTNIDVVEIANSLQLREALGLTVAAETPNSSTKPLIH